MGGFSGVLARMIRTDPRTPDAVAEYVSSVWSAHRTIPPAFARLHKNWIPGTVRDPIGSMCNLLQLAGTIGQTNN
jgi:hypothetical protein